MARSRPSRCRTIIRSRMNGKRRHFGASPIALPYFHDGRSPTLEEAIFRHQGDAVSVTRAFESLPASDQTSIIRFLKSLKAPAEAKPVADPRARPYLALTR